MTPRRWKILRRPSIALVAGTVLLAACSEQTLTPETPSLKPECGVASYYHHTLSGELTANGETYTPSRLTAAHNSLAFGTVVRVQRRDSDREVTVTINDRGPFIKGRIIDLSRAAARRLGIYGDEGVADVCLTIEARSS
jgi:rare lipoprotein A